MNGFAIPLVPPLFGAVPEAALYLDGGTASLLVVAVLAVTCVLLWLATALTVPRGDVARTLPPTGTQGSEHEGPPERYRDAA
jgi:hypothetical protein